MNTTFIDACFGKETPYTPVWYMRQAGRYLPEYRELKGDTNILDVVRDPEFAAKICLQPVDILGVDAAILYADIMIPLLGINVDLEIVESIGPVIKHPLESLKDVKGLRLLEPEEDIPYLLETIQIVQHELTEKVPLIGFSAAPFTLASYLIEGKPTRDFIKTKSFMYTNTPAWNILMEKLVLLITTYLKSQITAGVNAIQLFDSWVGTLGEADYQTYVLPYTQQIFQELQDFLRDQKKQNIPLIHFGTNTAGLLTSFASVPCQVIGIDWRISLEKARNSIGHEKALQGNLDPVVLLSSDFDVVEKHVDAIFDQVPDKRGFIFNLGHGVLKDTPVETVKRLTQYVHAK